MSVALQRKVHKVLDSRVRFDKPEVAEAIQSLSELQAASRANTNANAGTPGLTAVAAAARADGTGGVGASGSLGLHRHFRSLLESRHLSLHRALLEAFAPVAEQISALDSELAQTSEVALELAAALQDIKARSNSLFQSAEQINAQKKETAEKAEIVTTFLARFQLDPKDAELLASTDEAAIGPEYFEALEKVETIRANIQRMLVGAASTPSQGGSVPHTPGVIGMGVQDGLGAGSSRISLDLLDSLSKQLESSYELLYRSVSRQIQSGAVIKVSDLTPKFIRCFALLRNVPTYFEHCLADLLSGRRSLVIERFLKALSRGSGGTRPIELSAHDPVRYASDMLAWIHQALANEKEFLMALFPPENDPQPPMHSHAQHTASTEVKCYERYLCTIFEAASRILRPRIEQSFAGASAGTGTGSSGSLVSGAAPSSGGGVSVETVFKVWNILKFYAVIIEPILPPAAAAAAARSDATNERYEDDPSASMLPASYPLPSTDLLSTLVQLGHQARSAFFALLASSGSRLRSPPPAPSPDLTAGPLVSEWVSQLGSLMGIFNSALVAPGEKEAEFKDILDAALEPLLEGMGLGHTAAAAPAGKESVTAVLALKDAPASAASLSSDVDHCIYTLNVLHSLLSVCAQYPSFVRARSETLQLLVDTQAEKLVHLQARAVLTKVGLARPASAVSAWQSGSKSLPLSSADGLDLVSLSGGVKSFYTALQSIGAFLVPQCDRLLHTQTRRWVRAKIAGEISGSYRNIYEAIMDPQSGFDRQAMQALFLHAPQHIDLLLDVQGTAATPMQRNAAATASSSASSLSPSS